MTRALFVIFFSALVSAQTFRSSAEVVLITANVTKDGRPVSGLSANDFQITDNGAAQRVSLLQTDRMPIDVTIVLSAGDVRLIDPAFTSAMGFRSKLNSADRLRVISAGDAIIESEPMTSVSKAPDYQHEGTRGNSFNDALFYAFAWPTEPTRRHLVISYFINLDDWSTLDASMLPKLARRTDAVVNVVTMEPGNLMMGNRRAGWDRDTADLDRVARQTGGTMLPLAKAAKVFDQLLDEFRASYVLQFTPAGSAAGWHALSVTVPSMRGVTIKARQGYER